MKYDVTVKFKNGNEEVFTITTDFPNELIERTNIMVMENMGYWFNSSYVDCYVIKQHTDK